MSAYEELGMFLMICAHGVGNQLVQENFQHSGETIHRHFYSVLKAIGKLARDIIQPHLSYNDGAGDHKPCNKRYLPLFKAGWEGVAHDNRIFGEALRRPELNFSHPSGDKYYLVDVGYSHIKRYMAPYKGDNKYCRANIWGIESKVVYFARYAFFYHYDTQRDIVLATMAIHNYIKKKCKVDNAFQEAENERYVPHVDPDVGRFTRVNVANEENVENQGDNNIWMAIRDLIAQDIYDS
ncbi:uncharacterized protein [Nicotiana tomentosiformis]|uniref:uncharacterized protein n=1 Tax=Nicotiana tomentosiformis TaxID=4098 RepID=UPI00388CD3E2